jgi:hypothetical protein
MTVRVNPPPFLRLPPEFLKDKQTKAFIEQQNQIIFQLYQKLGGNTDPIADLQTSDAGGFSSYVQWIQKQAAGLPEFTIDTTGFTTDTTLITTDKVIA